MKVKIVCFISLTLSLIIFSCNNESPTSNEFTDTFAVYITNSTYTTKQIPELNKIDLVSEPLLSNNDISKYNWLHHQITFPQNVYDRIITRGNLLHKLFVIVANGQRIYWGRFMDNADSGGCQNPVIILYPRHPDGRITTPETFVINRAYPGYYGSINEPDIRNDPNIYQALKSCGILE